MATKTEGRMPTPIHFDKTDYVFLEKLKEKIPYTTSFAELTRSAIKFAKAYLEGEELSQYDNIFVFVKKMDENAENNKQSFDSNKEQKELF